MESPSQSRYGRIFVNHSSVILVPLDTMLVIVNSKQIVYLLEIRQDIIVNCLILLLLVIKQENQANKHMLFLLGIVQAIVNK